MARHVGEDDAVEAERDLDALVDQPDRLQRPQRRPGQADADAEHIPLRRKLDNVDFDIAAAKRNREREARDAAADDEDFPDIAPRYSGFSFAALTMSRKRS